MILLKILSGILVLLACFLTFIASYELAAILMLEAIWIMLLAKN